MTTHLQAVQLSLEDLAAQESRCNAKVLTVRNGRSRGGAHAASCQTLQAGCQRIQKGLYGLRAMGSGMG